MKNRFTITISDVNKTKSYDVHQVIKTVIKYFMLTILLAFIFGGVLILFLYNEVNNLEEKKTGLINEFKELLNDNEDLNLKIDNKNIEFQLIAEKVKDIEGLMGMSITTPETDSVSLSQRVDSIKLSTKQKVYTLRHLPNGSPLKIDEQLIYTSRYGKRIHPITGKEQFHKGVDLRAKTGTPVTLTADGIVEYSGFHRKSGLGKLVIVNHNFGFKTMYGHLDKIKVKTGQCLSKGDIIALSGNTGQSNAPHLHYEVRYLNIPRNPENYIKWTLKNYDNIFKFERKVKWQSLTTMVKKQLQILE